MKNEISIEDIVRLINTHSGNFYRNRDVYLIFDRIKKYLGIGGQENISLEQLKQVFGKWFYFLFFSAIYQKIYNKINFE